MTFQEQFFEFKGVNSIGISDDSQINKDIYDDIPQGSAVQDKMASKSGKLRSGHLLGWPYKHFLRKYKRRFSGMNAVRKKIGSKHQKAFGRTISLHGQLRNSLTHSHLNKKCKVPDNHHSHLLHGVHKNHVMDPNMCTDLISEIGGELSGNRGNGNSPFNSSNSCGSPECLIATNCCNPTSKSVDGALSSIDCRYEDGGTGKDCAQCVLSLEQNNNTDSTTCICGEEKISKRAAVSSDDDFIDVVSVEEEKNASVEFDLEECLDSQAPIKPNIDKEIACSSNFCRTSSQNNSMSTVDWQQQFMSFLSSSSKPGNEESPHQCNNSNHKSPSHSPRRKRSRKIRNSICACCIGGVSNHGRKQKHHSGHTRKHGLTRDHKHFIRDMVQLVSLRNKVVTLFCSVFPQCSDIIAELNPDSEKVDRFIDRVIGIMESTDDLSPCSFKEFKFDKSSQDEQEHLDINECPSLEGPIEDNFDEKGSGEMPVLDICRYDTPVEDKQCPLKFSINELDIQKRIGISVINEMEQMTENEAVHVNGQSEKSSCDSSINEELDGAMSEDTVLLSRRLKMFSEGDSGIIKDCDTSACLVEEDNPLLSSIQQNELNSSHSLLLNCQDEKCNTKNSNSTTTIRDNQSVLQKRRTEEKGPRHCIQDCETEIDKLSDVSDDDTIISDTVYPTLIDMSKDICEESSATEKSFTSDRTNDNRVITHNPAYSDISEASRISCSSPSHWTVNSEEVLGNKVEKWCAIGSKIETAEGNATSYSREINKLFSSENSNKHYDQDFLSEEAKVEAPCLPKLLPANFSTPCKKMNIVEIFESSVELCRKPKICLKALRKRINVLLCSLLPDINLRNSYFRNLDHLEYLLDAIISCNTETSEIS